MTNLTNTQIKSIVIFQSHCRTWLTNDLCFFKLIRARYHRTGIWCLTEDVPSDKWDYIWPSDSDSDDVSDIPVFWDSSFDSDSDDEDMVAWHKSLGL